MSLPAKKLDQQWSFEELTAYIAELIEDKSGNVLREKQQSMVVNRLKKRLIELGGITPKEYIHYLNTHFDAEMKNLVSLLTTHHTFFFREFIHFEFLLEKLPLLAEKAKSRPDKKIKILSAACSLGQEVYSLATFLDHHLSNFPGIGYSITGTDIDEKSIEHAKKGIYKYAEIKTIPNVYLSGKWQRGKGEISHVARIKDDIKKNCSFKTMNLIEQDKAIPNEKFDVIFCRNVFIYFNQEQIKKIVQQFEKHLNPGGFLITGLSESLKPLGIKLNFHGPSIYSFGELVEDIPLKSDTPLPTAKNILKIPSPIRLLIVDDSRGIRKLLGRIFESDPDFQVVGEAENGLEAENFLKTNKVDAMTLDIHMPQMDGVQYLKKNYKVGHPHVIIISSASREDARYAQETLQYGACDFVEKPALNNIEERSEEIKNKLRMAFINNSQGPSAFDKSLTRDFDIKDPEHKCRILFGTYSDLPKFKETLKNLTGEQPPCFLFFEGNENYLPIIFDEINKVKSAELYEQGQPIQKNKVYICDYSKHFNEIKSKVSHQRISVGIFGIASQKVADNIINFGKMQLLIEDIDEINKHLKEIASDCFPWTSFEHVATEYLAGEDK